jgi:hypothetical protein
MNTIKRVLGSLKTTVILAVMVVFGALLAMRPSHPSRHEPAPIVDGRPQPKPIVRRKVLLRRPATSSLRTNRASRVLGPDKASPCGAGSVSEQQPVNPSPADPSSDDQRRNTQPPVPSSTYGQGRVITSTSAVPPKTSAAGRAILRPISAKMRFGFWNNHDKP